MADVRLPDGTIIRNVPEGITQTELTARVNLATQQQKTPEQRQARISELEGELSAVEAEQDESALGAVLRGTASDIRGLPEAALSLGTGALATAAGGVSAIPVTAFEAARGGEDPAGAGKAVIEQFQEAGTFQPRTEVGQRATEAIAAPLESLERAATEAAVTDPDELAQRFPSAISRPAPGEPDVLAGGGSPLASTIVKTAILAAPALFGVRRGATVTRPSKTPTPRQQVAASAAEEGYVTPPSVRGEAGAAGLAEGIGGKIKTGQQAIETNQVVTNNLAARAVGLPEGVPVTIDVLQGIRAEAGKAYQAVKGIGQVFTDTVFRRELSRATREFKDAAKDFPALAEAEVIKIVDGLNKAEFNSSSGVAAISRLRNKADVAFQNGDSGLGNAYKSASSAVEGVMERHLGRGSDTALLESFRQARQQIATTYSVQEALQARITGEVNAANLASQLKKGVPLTGDLRTIADFANTFPTVSKLFTATAQKLSPVDVGVAAISGTGALGAMALGASPATILPALAVGASRPLLRGAALTNAARRSGLTPGSTRPAPNALLGIATSGALREDQ